MDTLLRIESERKKALHPAVSKPTTSRVWLGRHVLYCCATTAALVLVMFLLQFASTLLNKIIVSFLAQFCKLILAC